MQNQITNIKLNEGLFFNTVTYKQGGWTKLVIFELLYQAKKFVGHLENGALN